MYAQTIDFKLKPGTTEEARKLIEDKFVPWLQGREGFHGLHAAKFGDNEILALDIWGSKKDLDASKSEQEQEISRTFGHILASPPDFKESDIVIHGTGHEPHAKERHAA